MATEQFRGRVDFMPVCRIERLFLHDGPRLLPQLIKAGENGANEQENRTIPPFRPLLGLALRCSCEPGGCTR